MQKVGKLKKLKGKCPVCENKFIATADDFFMTQNVRWGTFDQLIRCPYCKTYLYKVFGRIWSEPYWDFKIIKECK